MTEAATVPFLAVWLEGDWGSLNTLKASCMVNGLASKKGWIFPIRNISGKLQSDIIFHFKDCNSSGSSRFTCNTWPQITFQREMFVVVYF